MTPVVTDAGLVCLEPGGRPRYCSRAIDPGCKPSEPEEKRERALARCESEVSEGQRPCFFDYLGVHKVTEGSPYLIPCAGGGSEILRLLLA